MRDLLKLNVLTKCTEKNSFTTERLLTKFRITFSAMGHRTSWPTQLPLGSELDCRVLRGSQLSRVFLRPYSVPDSDPMED